MNNPQVSKSKVVAELSGLQSRLTLDEQRILAGMILLSGDSDSEVEGHMMPSLTTFDVAQRHQAELLREANYIHMVNEASAGKQPLWPKITSAVGHLLVNTGYKVMPQPTLKPRAA
ncbi:MAG TPA: hypothetical protein VF813_09980 [Anaerolineaceae bacterium]